MRNNTERNVLSGLKYVVRKIIVWSLFAVYIHPLFSDWIFLADGRVGNGEVKKKQPVTVTFPDGTEEEVLQKNITEIFSEAQVNAAVDRVVTVTHAGKIDRNYFRSIIGLKAAAVPRLVYYLKNKDTNLCMMSLLALQHCWSPAARRPVESLVHTRSRRVVRMAMTVLHRQLSSQEFAQTVESLINGKDKAIAGRAFEYLEMSDPDVDRMKRFMSDGKMWKFVWKYLPRYYSPELTPLTITMMKKWEKNTQAAAIVALIHQNCSSEKVRKLIKRLLTHVDSRIKDRAAEYFTWHGTTADIPALKHALENTEDVFTKASIKAAKKAIERRDTVFHSPEDVKPITLDYEYKDNRPYMAALRSYLEKRTFEARKKAYKILCAIEPFEPFWKYGKEKPKPDFVKERSARFLLQAHLFAIPGLAKIPGEQPLFKDEKAHIPVADTLIAPVRGFFNPKRKSFGQYIGPGQGVFSNSVHIGDDMAFYRDHETVVTIGNGLVRGAWVGPSWGGIIIIEHRLDNGTRFCSLYAHMSPFFHVKPGERVKKGEKIGSLGRTYTWENGGYPAHLHFAVHKGPFIQKTPWICGYISKKKFKTNNHGWIAPQTFIKRK